jgi:hypothetical protein
MDREPVILAGVRCYGCRNKGCNVVAKAGADDIRNSSKPRLQYTSQADSKTYHNHILMSPPLDLQTLQVAYFLRSKVDAGQRDATCT